MNKNEWLSMMEDASFINTMFQLYLKRTGQWKPSWDDVIGSRFYYRDTVWDSMYGTVDEDFVEVSIATVNDDVARRIIIFADFLDWCEKRKNG